MSTIEYLQQINDIQQNKSQILVIELSKKELNGYTYSDNGKNKKYYTGFDFNKIELIKWNTQK